MKAVLQTAVLVMGFWLAPAQEPAEGLAPTNSGALPAKDELTLSLPRIGVDFKSPQTQVVRTGATLEDGLVGDLFQESTNVVAQDSVLETGEQVFHAPLDSLALRRETEVANAGGMLVSGPLVNLFHGSRPGEVPKRFLQLVNPFAPMEPAPITPSVPGERRKAWTALIGWNPGGSSFPDPRTHVPTLDLLTMFTSP